MGHVAGEQRHRDDRPEDQKVTALTGLGFKDHSIAGQGLDASKDSQRSIKTWPVFGTYLPDAIATLRSGNQTFLVTANEGDVREYDGLNAAGNEAVEVEDIALDATAFPNAVDLKKSGLGIGKLKVTSFNGDTDGDGDYDQLYAFGARSFSIWSTDGTLKFDSGDALERITKAAYPNNFNASSTNNTLDDRSDDKGPEPEGIAVASLFGRTYIFVMLERIGGVVVYEATNPTAPTFVQYINTRNFAAAGNTPSGRRSRRRGRSRHSCGVESKRQAAADRVKRGQRQSARVRDRSGEVTLGRWFTFLSARFGVGFVPLLCEMAYRRRACRSRFRRAGADLERRDGGLDRTRPACLRAPQRIDVAVQRRLHGHHPHAVGHTPAPQAGDHRCPKTCRDQRQLGGMLPSRVRDDRLVALCPQRVHQPVVAHGARLPHDPALVG